jgi:hypothetical protein
MTEDFNRVKELTAIVVDDMQKRFPNCSHTVRILLWDDATCLVECRHARKVGDNITICNSTFYDGELKYEEYPMDFDFIKIDEKGNEYQIKIRR